MARCILGPEKHKKCEEITGKKYEFCTVRGNTQHYVASCSYKENDKWKSDYVNYKTKEWTEEET